MGMLSSLLRILPLLITFPYPHILLSQIGLAHSYACDADHVTQCMVGDREAAQLILLQRQLRSVGPGCPIVVPGLLLDSIQI